MLRNSDSHNEKYGWNSIPDSSSPRETPPPTWFQLELTVFFVIWISVLSHCHLMTFEERRLGVPNHPYSQQSMKMAMNHDLIFNDGCIFGLKCRPRKALGVWPRLLRTINRTAASRCFVCTPTYPFSRHPEVRWSNRINLLTPQLLSVTSDFGLKCRYSLPMSD